MFLFLINTNILIEKDLEIHKNIMLTLINVNIQFSSVQSLSCV